MQKLLASHCHALYFSFLVLPLLTRPLGRTFHLISFNTHFLNAESGHNWHNNNLTTGKIKMTQKGIQQMLHIHP